jgi:hypothetical protein
MASNETERWHDNAEVEDRLKNHLAMLMKVGRLDWEKIEADPMGYRREVAEALIHAMLVMPAVVKAMQCARPSITTREIHVEIVSVISKLFSIDLTDLLALAWEREVPPGLVN